MESLSNNPEAHGWEDFKEKEYDLGSLIKKIKQLQAECESLRKIIIKMCSEKYLRKEGE